MSQAIGRHVWAKFPTISDLKSDEKKNQIYNLKMKYIYIYKQGPYLNFPEGNFEEKKSDLQENLLINYESQSFDSKFVNISTKG